jgi:hypothetical protein
MAPRWRPRPKPKPRPVKTKKPTDFNIRESGTSLGELVPTQPLLDIPSPKTTDLPVPKTGLAATPEGKESVKKILTGPEMKRRTFNTGLIQMILQAILPTPKLSLTKEPVPVPKVKTGWPRLHPDYSDWNTMKEDLEEIVDNQINLSSNRLLDDLNVKFEDEFHKAVEDGRDFDSFAMDRTEEVVGEIVHDIMNWKVRENPNLVHDLISNWKKAAKIQSHEPGFDQLEIGTLNYQDNIAERIQDLIEKDLMTGFDKYRDTKKYNEEWFKKTAKNLESIPNSPPPFKTSHEMFIHNSKADAIIDQIPDNPSPSQVKQTTLWGDANYEGLGRTLPSTRGYPTGRIQREDLPMSYSYPNEQNWLTKAEGPIDQPITRKIIDDSFESARNRLGHDLFGEIKEGKIDYLNTVELSLHDEGLHYLPLRRNYLISNIAKGLEPLPKKLKKEISEGKVAILGSRATKYITDKELKYLDDLFNKYTKGYELPEDLAYSFSVASRQLTQPFRVTPRYEGPDKRDEFFKRISRPKGKFGKHYEVNKTDAAHPYIVPRSDAEYFAAKEDYRKVRAAADKFLQGKPGDTLLQIEPKREEVRKRLEDLGYEKEIIGNVLDDLFTIPDSKGLSVLSDDIVEKITELQTTPDPVTKGLSAISDDITEKITEVQTTPDPITGTIDKKITELEDEAEFQARQAQKAKTTGDVLDQIKSRRQFLLPHKKNTGGLVGLY